jgi:hypothetical protein
MIIFYNFLTTFSCSNLIRPKLCVNCKYFIKGNFFSGNKFGKCSLLPIPTPEKINIDFLVDGFGSLEDKKKDYYFCSTSRKFDDLCGKEGKLYKNKCE